MALLALLCVPVRQITTLPLSSSIGAVSDSLPMPNISHNPFLLNLRNGTLRLPAYHNAFATVQ